MKKSLLLIAGSVSFALVLAGCTLSLAEDVPPPPGYEAPTYLDVPEVIEGAFPASLPNAANGAALYPERCAPCHGDLGLGDGPQASQLPVPPAAIGNFELASQRSPAQWYAMVTNGKIESFMPPFSEGLTDQERWDVVAYAFSLSAQPELIDAGASVYDANCAECHGVNGEGNAEGATDFTSQEVMVGRSDLDIAAATLNGVGSGMPAYGDELDDFSIQAVTAFVRSFSLLPYVDDGLPESVAIEPTTEPTAAIARPDVSETPSADTTEQPQFSDEPLTGEFRGIVANGSGGELPANLKVTLYGYDHTTEAVVLTAQARPDGSFVFRDVELVPERLYFATVDYQGQVYGSDFVIADFGTMEYDLPVTLYESTSDPSGLVVSRMHLFLEFPEPDLMQVVELVVITNPTNLAVVPAGQTMPALEFSLPEGAENLAFQEGELGDRFVTLAGGFGDTRAVLPGSEDYQLLFAYTLPYTRRLEFAQPLDMGAEAVIVFLPADGLTLKSDQLTDGGPQDLGGLVYEMYVGEGLTQGDALAFSLSGRHPLAGGFSISSDTRSLLLGGLGLALALAGAWLWLRERNSIAGPADEEEFETPEDVMDAIIALDEAYERGEVTEADYSSERSELKSILAELLDE
ncbi:MAG: c-type cytochrome [Anaerolineae bacterium]|nr:MAG: c-type cytochrome [Anaerolineae bacterium]